MSKLLIVDDEMDIREFARNFFVKRGIEVYTSSGGYDTLDILEREKPDLILLDIRMEEMTGVELLRRIKEKDPEVKVIMVSGVTDEDIMTGAKKLGAIGYVHKPLVLDELEKIVLKELRAGS